MTIAVHYTVDLSEQDMSDLTDHYGDEFETEQEIAEVIMIDLEVGGRDLLDRFLESYRKLRRRPT
jgi:hypothetical protein